MTIIGGYYPPFQGILSNQGLRLQCTRAFIRPSCEHACVRVRMVYGSGSHI